MHHFKKKVKDFILSYILILGSICVFMEIHVNNIVLISLVFSSLGLNFFIYKFNLVPRNNLLKIKFSFYFFWLVKEIVLSSWKVSFFAWSKNCNFGDSSSSCSEPNVITIKSHSSDFKSVIYANSITLTPGTVTIEQSKDFLIIHSLQRSFSEDMSEKGNMYQFIDSTIRT